MSLPEDIIFDVLVRLPVRALCRSQCVSKAWRALISDPGFVAAQRSRAGPLIVGVFGSWPHLELRVLDMHGDVLCVLEDVGGTAVLAPTRLDLICVNRRWQGAMIVDPAAGRVFTIKHDEEIQWNNYSFGRAAQSGAYKVLRVAETHSTFSEVATITVVDSGGAGAEPAWRKRPTPDSFNRFSSVHKATVNGVLYFMSDNVYQRTPGWNRRVAAFDLESEVWMDTINGPPLEEQEDSWIALTELKETLCMVHNIRGLYSDIWHLIDHNRGVSWVKAHTIRLPTGCQYTEAWDVLDDGRILLLNRICSRFFLQFFNPRTKTFTDIMEMAEEFSGTMTLYTGSLLSS